jgi:hypothetical protein
MQAVDYPYKKIVYSCFFNDHLSIYNYNRSANLPISLYYGINYDKDGHSDVVLNLCCFFAFYDTFHHRGSIKSVERNQYKIYFTSMPNYEFELVDSFAFEFLFGNVL